MSRAVAVLLAGTLALLPDAVVAQASVPTPASILGFEPGTDRKLPTWKQVTEYFAAIDRASNRVQVRTLGKTVQGRPFIVAYIADPATLANLDQYRQIQRKLMDPSLRTATERERLLSEGKNVILITSSIHSTEVGGFLTPFVLADRLARGTSAEVQSILQNTIIMLVPSQNPDGVDIVGNWYRATLGTPAEGSQPPELYHYYTGHDNNRDWYAFTQPETRYTIDSLYTPWNPQIVNDIHQQGSNGGRIFIPPYMDPVEPNIDPVLTAGTNSLGMEMAWRLLAEGKVGVATNASYDQWSPARQYSLNHRGVRILTETASARLASPMDIPFQALGTARGYDAKVSSWNHPAVWKGGTWGIGNIVDYQSSATWAMLAAAARDRRMWLESYAALGDRAVAANTPWTSETSVPSAFVIPRGQRDRQALDRLVWTLQHGQVELRPTTGPVTVEGKTYPAGSYAVLVRQNFGSYAKALLERQKYPDLREYPGGPPKRPYDVTAHTLPLLIGVEVATVFGAPPPTGGPIAAIPEPKYSVQGLTDSRARRIGIYRSYAASMDEGWTRWIFDAHRVPFTTIVDRDIRAGQLIARFDAIIIPDQSAAAITRGLPSAYPDSVRGGLGDDGTRAVVEFVEQGGTLMTFNDASLFAIEAMKLPVKNALEGVRNTEFYAPGSIMAADMNRNHPMTRGVTAPVLGVWFEDSPAFEITDPSKAIAVLTYPTTGNPLLSGWLLGGQRLNGKAAMVEAPVGKGKVVLYGFRPQYRGQTNATLPLIWDAIGRGTAQ
ncbi:MAG: M14 family metallopeptidase [Gemmatimonadaceae bacterium]